MNKNLAIVSGCDAAYFHLLRGLVRSLRDTPEGKNAPLYLFDVGLTDEQRQWLAAQGAALSKPKPLLPKDVPSYISLITARASIPDYFPGHSAYLWLDADAWIQDAEALSVYFNHAMDSGFCVTPEIHPSYNERNIRAARKRIRSWYGQHITAACIDSDPINLGVFCGRADAPHWPRWRNHTDTLLLHSTTHDMLFNSDQEAFGLVIHHDRMECAKLPARYNWLCHAATPMIDSEGRQLLEPMAPHDKLAIVHMTLWTKKRMMELLTPDGKKREYSLAYGNEALPENRPDMPDLALKNLT